MKNTINAMVLLLLFASNSCSKLTKNSKLTSAFNINNVKDSLLFKYQKDSICLNKRLYYKYTLKNKVENIEGYWGFKNDTLFCLKYTADFNNPPNECLLIVPIFIKNLRSNHFSLSMEQCGYSLGALSIMKIESNLIKSDSYDTLYSIKHTLFERPYFPKTIKDEKILNYVFSVKHGFIEFESLNKGNLQNLYIWDIIKPNETK